MSLTSKLGIGTVQFGIPYGISNKSGQTTPGEVSKILMLAKIAKISTIDTATTYGTSEQVLGKNNLSGFKVVSKFMPPVIGKSIYHQLMSSLEKININTLYGYLAHRPMDILINPSQWEELKQLKKEHLVEKVGFSLSKPSELEDLVNHGFIPDLIQIPFNYLDRRFLPYLAKLKKQGCEVHSRSTFLQGLFFSEVDNLDPFFNEVKPIVVSLQKGIQHLPAALLKFALEQPLIDKVIIGVENTSQLKDCLESIKLNHTLTLPTLYNQVSDNILIPSNWPKL